jgi:hypothetical protein
VKRQTASYRRRPIGIHSIFKKDSNGHYTTTALLYQDMIRYCIARKELDPNHPDSFKHWDLADCIIRNNQEDVNYYKDMSTRSINMGSRIENIQQRTKDRLNDLVQLNLVEISGSEKQEKGNAYVNVYKYTFFGHLLAWLIESFNPQKREKATKEIYNLFNSFYKQYKNWSYYVFSSALYKKYFDKGVFEDFVVDRIRETLDMNMEIWSMQELLRSLTIPSFYDDKDLKVHMQLWNETLNEMDPNLRPMFLYKLKLEIEREMEYRIKNQDVFEKLCFEIRDKYDMIVMEGYCKNCNLYMYGTGSLLEYLQVIGAAPSEYVMAKCTNCNNDSAIVQGQGYF